MNNNVRQILSEALGVPKNIVNVATELYNQILNIIPPNYTFEQLNGFEYKINGEFEISDHKFNEVSFKIDLSEHDTLEIAGMYTGEQGKLTKKFNIKTKLTNTFDLGFNLVGPETTTGQDVIELMKEDKLEFIGSIAHELKHRYDKFKKPKTNLASKTKYVVASSNGFANINSINEFIHYLYYTHVVENLVRPSEIAALIEAGEITKKDFYKFLTDTRTYNRLNSIRNFTYDGLKRNLETELPKIKKVFTINSIEYDDLTDDEIINKTLDLVYINLKNWQASFVHRKLLSNPFELLTGFSGDKEEFFQGYLKNLERFGDNYEKFFKYEIKLMNYVGSKMIKKIFKLYDLAKDYQNESIINWEVWRMLNENNMKIETKPKFKKR